MLKLTKTFNHLKGYFPFFSFSFNRSNNQAQDNKNPTNESLYSVFQRLFLRVQFSNSKRVEFYEVLAMMLKVGSFSNAIHQMIITYEKHARKIAEPKRILIDILTDVAYRHNQLGLSAIDALSIYVPKSELMMLSGARQLSIVTLQNTISMTQKLAKMRSKIIRQLISPVVYLISVGGMLAVVDFGLSPIIESAGTGHSIPTSTQVLIGVSHWFVLHYVLVITAVILVIALMITVIATVVNRFRLSILDRLPPFSIYKKITSVRFLIALSLLLQGSEDKGSRLPIPESIKKIQLYSSKYLSHFLIKMRDLISQGKHSGEVLVKSGLFHQSLVGLIEMYAQSNQLETGIYQLANAYLDKQIQMIESAFKVFNYVFLLAIGAFIVWYVSVMYSLNQIFAHTNLH